MALGSEVAMVFLAGAAVTVPESQVIDSGISEIVTVSSADFLKSGGFDCVLYKRQAARRLLSLRNFG